MEYELALANKEFDDIKSRVLFLTQWQPHRFALLPTVINGKLVWFKWIHRRMKTKTIRISEFEKNFDRYEQRDVLVRSVLHNAIEIYDGWEFGTK